MPVTAGFPLHYTQKIVNVHWGNPENFAAIWSDEEGSHFIISKDGTLWEELDEAGGAAEEGDPVAPSGSMTSVGYGGGRWYVGTFTTSEEDEPSCSIMQSDSSKMESWSNSYSDTGLIISIAGGRGPNGAVIVAAIRASEEPGDTNLEASVKPSKLITYAKPDPDPESEPIWTVTKTFGDEGQIHSVSFCRDAFFACIGCGNPRGGFEDDNPRTAVKGGAAIYRSEDGIAWSRIYSDTTEITRTVIANEIFEDKFWESTGSSALGVAHYRIPAVDDQDEPTDQYCAYVTSPVVLMNTVFPAPKFMTSSDGKSFTGGAVDNAHWAILGSAPFIAGGYKPATNDVEEVRAFPVAVTSHMPFGEGVGLPRAVPSVPVDVVGPGADGELDFEPPPLLGSIEPASTIAGAPVCYSKTEKKFALMGMGNVLDHFESPLQRHVRIYSSSDGKTWNRVYEETGSLGSMMSMAVGSISKYSTTSPVP